MALAGLTPKKVAGRHLILFETYYLALDPTSKGAIGAMEAATFLKRSQLSDTILSKIWDLSDPAGKGALDKLGFFVSLKLVALAQNGKEVTTAGLLDDVPEPEMDAKAAKKQVNSEPAIVQPKPVVPPQPQPAKQPPIMDWTPKENELNKYKQMYQSRGPENGKIPGAKAKSLLMESQLPVDKLGKIWDLADVDKDGSLSEGEFIIAMHLVCKCLETGLIPDVLPNELQNFLARSIAPPAVPPLPSSMQSPAHVQPPMQKQSPAIAAASAPLIPVQNDNWVVPVEDRVKFKTLFDATDQDRDGFVSGLEIKNVFLQSGLQQNTLAHIWNLCDTDQSGKLSVDQFALAMWLVRNTLQGIPPPAALTPEMIPPGMAPPAAAPPPPPEPELNPEFELIIKEINELSRERVNTEDEIISKESEKKIKTGEIKSLQQELDTLTATLKQLENQKSVAIGKLGELESQVTSLRQDAEQQESTLVEQETEVNGKATELRTLDQEERDITNNLDRYAKDIEKYGNMLQDTLLQISQMKTRVTSLGELKVGMDESVTKFTSALESGNVYTITEPELRDVKPELDELIGTSPSPHYLNGDTAQSNGFESFEPSFPQSPQPSWGDAFGSTQADNFAPKDPFAPHDPFAPATGASSSQQRQDFSPGKDPFGQEPFAEEAAPALPPKKPPPRPAPPKGAPARPPPPAFKAPTSNKPDPFSQPDNASSSGFDSEFADFANFDNQPWSSQPTKLEFTEDPFKNYRYEDPFANSDPFAG